MGDLLQFAKSRIEASLAEANRLDTSEFPYKDSREALSKIRELFETILSGLGKLDAKSDPGVIKQKCALSLGDLFHYVPLLGFVLRSTNVRNAFEVFGPLKRLAREVLEHGIPEDQRKTRLILSSEWDYSPFVLGEIPALDDFVLIGIPSPESSNPLLIPLAGHELGHSLWSKRKLGIPYKSLARKHVVDAIKARWTDFEQVFVSKSKKPSPTDLTTDMFCVQFWAPALDWALSQIEETFCDFVGLWLFGKSYLNAFAYLLSPNVDGARSLHYPNMKTRVENLSHAATIFGVSGATAFTDMFEDMPTPALIPSDAFRLTVADAATDELIDQIATNVNDLLSTTDCEQSDPGEVERIVKRFHKVIPAEDCNCLGDILNAAWEVYLLAELWKDMPHVHANKDRVVKELVLKNIELFEIENIVGK